MKKLFFAIAIVSLFTGCLKGDDNEFTCSFQECGVTAPASEIQAVSDYLTANNISGATQHCSGMFYIIDNPGTGTKPTVCNTIAVTYEGKLTNGRVFDQTSTPRVFNLAQLIRGFQVGIPLIKAGGTIRLFVPPSLGYGPNATGDIPPNSILIFTVSLTGVQ